MDYKNIFLILFWLYGIFGLLFSMVVPVPEKRITLKELVHWYLLFGWIFWLLIILDILKDLWLGRKIK